MDRTIVLSDDAYQALCELAQQTGQTPDATAEALIVNARQQGPFYETDDWFRHLGMTEEEIAEAKAVADADAGA